MEYGDFRREVLSHADGRSGTWVYRGQREPGWHLATTYARFLRAASVSFDLASFYAMLERFIRRASELQGQDYAALSLAQQIALAQHSGLPTPFLDWTYSPFIAVYFALASDTGRSEASPFVVHALRIDGNLDVSKIQGDRDLHEVPCGRAAFVDTTRFFSRRIVHQRGCFTFQNFSGCLFGGYLDPKWKRTFEIFGDDVRIRRELALMGITAANLFDDLDHLALDVRCEELEALRT